MAGFLMLSAAALAACLVFPAAQTPYPTDTLIPPTTTATATTVWFPPTATYTPLPSATLPVTPTLDVRPRYGALVVDDDFDDPSLWTLGRAPAGNIALGLNELTLAVAQEKGYLFSLYQGATLGDFYAEITASPSICRQADEYGLLLRVSPALEFYRFSLTCDGQARVDRFYRGVASSPIPLTPHGAIPRGAPSASRLAVWALGRDMRFYVNGIYLFSVRDPTLPSGSLGVFARAAGPEAVTVNFSDLAIYELEPSIGYDD